MPPPPLFSAAVLLLLLAGNLPASVPQPTTSAFPGCDRSFSCGNIHNLTYPFTGGDRPDYCGPPQFRLTCPTNNNDDQDTYPELTSGNFTYRVVEADPTAQTLVLARLDLWNNTCPSRFVNTTLDPTVFVAGDDENVDLSIFFGCNSMLMSIEPQNRFFCDVGVVGFQDSYFLIGPVPNDPILSFIQCVNGVRVPLLRTVADDLTGGELTLGEALTRGFRVNYTVPSDEQCSDCSGSGRECGFNVTTGQPICICDGRICYRPGSSNNGTLTIVLPIVGAIVAGICIGWGVFVCRQRRRRAIAAAKTESKGILTSDSSKELVTTPTSTFTSSIPSYPSSRTMGLGKSTYFGAQVFTYEELELATDNFDDSRELGNGGFGTVYYGKLIDGREVAVKRLFENNFKRVEQFMNEVEILKKLHHENLVKLYGCTSKRSRELILVYEYIANGTVADHLHGKLANSNPGSLTWAVRLNIAIETANALTYLHESDIIHRDVKTNNILLDENFRVKVADFGLSRLFPNDATHVSTAPQGTPGYVDPEYYQCYRLTDKSDVYSFGVVLMELISALQAVDINRHRHDINLANMAINKIQNRTLAEMVDKSIGFETNGFVRRAITLVAELAFRCLQSEKDMRPTMKEVVETLRGLRDEEFNVQKPEVLDIVVDDGALLKGYNTNPSSPESGVTDKLVGTSVLNSSGG